jgi:hypothetical protein
MSKNKFLAIWPQGGFLKWPLPMVTFLRELPDKKYFLAIWHQGGSPVGNFRWSSFFQGVPWPKICHRRSILILIYIPGETTHFLSRYRNYKKQSVGMYTFLSIKTCLFQLKFYMECDVCVSLWYDAKHAVWNDTDLIDCDIKWAENCRVDRNERARMEVHSTIFGQFSAKWAFRLNGLFGQMSYSAKYFFRPNGFRQNGLSDKRGRIYLTFS